MKNSAATKSSWSLFSIDENRLSFGLLILLILGGLGYGLWSMLSPLISMNGSGSQAVSLRQVADDHFKHERYNDAINSYREMVLEDPNNGYAISRIAAISRYQWKNNWKKINELAESDADSPEVNSLKDDSSQRFEFTVSQYTRLLDFARYRCIAYLNLACLHSEQFVNTGNEEESELAIATIEEMLSQKYYSQFGIDQIKPLRGIASHPKFATLKKLESTVKRSVDDGSSFFAPPTFFRDF